MSLEKIKEIFDPKALVGIDATQGKAKLVENSTGAKTNKITITGLKENSVIVNLDRDSSKPLSILINATLTDINKRCDYVIFSIDNNNKITALFCELKSTRSRRAEKQLISSKYYIDYIVSLCSYYFNISKIKYTPKYSVLIGKSGFQNFKTGTKQKIPVKDILIKDKGKNINIREYTLENNSVSITELI